MKSIVARTWKYIIYGLGGIQILLGILWTIRNFAHLSRWQETIEYIEISKTWILDEYVGILYPLMIKLFMLVEGVVGVPFFMPIYFLQLCAAAGSGWLICKGLFSLSKNQSIWVVGYLITFPMLLQTHLSISPWSFVFSAQIALMGILLQNIRSKYHLLFAGTLTILSGLLYPDALWISLCIWLFTIRKMVKREVLMYIGTIFMAVIITLGTLGLIQMPGSRGRIQKTFWAGAFQRVVTEYFSRSYAMWDENVRTTFTIEEAMECAKRSDNMMYVVGPALEKQWGRKAANESYKDMTLSCLRVRTRAVVYQIRDDVVDSMLMPFSVLWQSQSERTSQTGWNYDHFKENTKGMAAFYLYFSIIGLIIIIFMGVVIDIVQKRKVKKDLLIFLGIAFVQATYVALGSGNGTNYRELLLLISVYCIIGMKGIEL